MRHGVTVGTNGAKVFDRVDFVTLSTIGKGDQMMNVDVARSYLSVKVLQIQAADGATCPVVVDAGSARISASFVHIHRHLMGCAFAVLHRRDLVRTLEKGPILGSVFEGPKDFNRSLILDISRRRQSGILKGIRIRLSPE